MEGEVFVWGIAIASLVGTVANVKKKRWCFWIWLVTNSAWVVYDVEKDALPQAALMLVYAGLAVWGLVSWRKEKHE